MNEADLWTPHLQADERVLWQAGVVEDHYRAELSHQRKLGAAIMVAAIVAAILLGKAFLDMIGRPPADSHVIAPNLPNVFAGPIYVALILACLIVAAAQVMRFNLPRPAAAWFAATSKRLLAVDARGALVDQIDGAAIADVEVASKARAHDLVVHRKADAPERRPFSIAYIDRPIDAKAIIEQTFLEPGHEQAD